MTRIAKLLVGGALAAALFGGTASAETTTMRFSVWIPMTHPVHTGIYVPWAQNVEKATEGEDILAARIGYARINHFSWKDVLDFYTCTECGRCSDNCPAFKTGKILSPKHFILDLRNHLYSREPEIEAGSKAADAPPPAQRLKPVDLVPEIIHPDVLWACTTCRACEEQCPVNITPMQKIVQMRRNLVVIKGEFPQELAKPFEMSLPAISKHLKVLERAGLISRGRDAQWRPCRLDAGPLKAVADWTDSYRRFWEDSFDKLDAYLTHMENEGDV